MKKRLCISVKRKGYELAIKHIEIEKVIIPISYYKRCVKRYPISYFGTVLYTFDYFARNIGPLRHTVCTAPERSISLKKRSLYTKSIGLSGICRIIENASIEDYIDRR